MNDWIGHITSLLTVCIASLAVAAEPPITAIAFAPDGQSVVVGSQAGLTVHRWPDLKALRNIETTMVNVHDAAFSPGGKLLAVAGGAPSEAGLVEIYSWPSGASLGVCRGHEDSVMAVAWKGESSFVTASLDRKVALWSAKSREAFKRLAGHSRGATSICLLEGGATLVSGSLDQSLRVWNVATGELSRTLNNHTREVVGLATRPNSPGLPMIASISRDRTVRLWQPTIGRMVRFVKLDASPLAVAWLPDGSRVAVSTTSGRLLLIDPDTVQITRDVRAVDGWAYALAAHPDGNDLLVAGRNGALERVPITGAK